MANVDARERTQLLCDVHVEDIGTTAYELARLEPDLATCLVAVLAPVEGDEDPGRRPRLLHVTRCHMDDVWHT